MVRVSNPASSKIILAATLAWAWSIPLVLFIWVTGSPDLWKILGFDAFYENGGMKELHKSLSFYDKFTDLFIKTLFYAVIISPLTFTHALRTVPKRLVFTDTEITAVFFSGTKSYPYSAIKKISFLERNNGNPFLRIQIGKRTLNLEVNDGQIREIHKHIPLTGTTQ